MSRKNRGLAIDNALDIGKSFMLHSKGHLRVRYPYYHPQAGISSTVSDGTATMPYQRTTTLTLVFSVSAVRRWSMEGPRRAPRCLPVQIALDRLRQQDFPS